VTKEQGIEYDKDQNAAIKLISSGHDPLCIITGGPGTGKTTIIKAALHHLTLAKKRIALVAPTGKAAKRIHEVTGRPTATLHRLLGYTGDGFPEDHQVTEDVILVDEASMVDVELGYALMRAVKSSARIILVGDADQLPSVGAGSLLRDLLDSGCVRTVRLKTLHRSAQESWVCTNAPKILEGQRFDVETRSDFALHEVSGVEDCFETLDDLLRHHAADFWAGKFQILTPQNVGDLGTELLNNILADSLNPARNEHQMVELAVPKASMQSFLGVRDRVIQVTNNYRVNVFNGEIGTVDRIENGKVYVRFDSRFVEYTAAGASYELRLAYALTVHKSQGSEWDHVAVLCHSMHSRMWSRQLLYTAVTRAKKAVYIVGNDAGIGMALKQNKPRERFTTLPERLAQGTKQEQQEED
jgi:exodeoxyribonuclease V alpha subunit